MTEQTRATVQVTGVVQGVGFRPFVSRTAVDADVAGSVRNAGDHVEAIFEGSESSVAAVIERLRADPPPLARVDGVDVTWTDPNGIEGFTIEESAADAATGGVPVPPDTGICEACLDDVRDPTSRYHGYWATACVDCGPRYTIVRGVPYDRTRTAMADFSLCAACRSRYDDPADRRYHAQAIACPDCGPTLRFASAGAAGEATDADDTGREAIRRAGRRLRDGAVLGVKGIGGVHLVCDATDEALVTDLRDRIDRPANPLALMVPSIGALSEFATVSDRERETLMDVRRPIVLVDRADDARWLDAVAPGLHTVGVMLPYAGLHHLLFDHVDGPLVMTSGNRPGVPMCTTTAGLQGKLGDVVDGVVTHDREIVTRCDDSVVRVVDGSRRFLRRSRGWTPAALPNPAAADGASVSPILALGPERDVTVALADGDRVVLSQHVGDVDDPDTVAFARDTVDHLTDLTGIEPTVVACDAHPDFLTTAEAERVAAEGAAGPVRVQHHHAHAASLLAEHDVSRAVVVAADGTGYGPDGSVWGGEVLDVTFADFERVGGLADFALPGGAAAVRTPARVLASVLDDEARIDECLLASGAVETDAEAAIVRQQADEGVNAPTTTSAGRFLDAVSALVGACEGRRYEGEPAQRLEALASEGTVRSVELPFATRAGQRVLDVCALASRLDGLLADWPRADVAATAQDALARGLAQIAIEAAGERGIDAVGFTGGVAYNDAISRRLRDCVTDAGLTFLIHSRIPPGDGGVAYGQAVVATASHFG